MTPVLQSIVCPERGDCMSACLASILDLPLSEVPKFNADQVDHNPGKDKSFRDRDAHYAMLDWLYLRGYGHALISWNSLSDWRGLRDVSLIASVPSQKFSGVSHAVIIGFKSFANVNRAYEWYVAHDPNPTNRPYDYTTVKPTFVHLLIPIKRTP